MRHCDAQREGKSIWFPNSGKVLGERFVLLFYVMLHCPSFNPLPLCLTFPALLPFILLPGNANCCFFKGSLATWMDCMYISFKCGSTSMISWQRVCVCVVGRRKGVFLWEREERACLKLDMASIHVYQTDLLSASRHRLSKNPTIQTLETGKN